MSMSSSSPKRKILEIEAQLQSLQQHKDKLEKELEDIQEMCVDMTYANKVESNIGKTGEHALYTIMDGKEWCGPNTHNALKKLYTPTSVIWPSSHMSVVLLKNNMDDPVYIDLSKFPKHFFDLIDLPMFDDQLKREVQQHVNIDHSYNELYHVNIGNLPVTKWTPKKK